MDSLCQFHMVAHKKGAAAVGGDNRKSGGVEERLRQTTAVKKKGKKDFQKCIMSFFFGNHAYICEIQYMWLLGYYEVA